MSEHNIGRDTFLFREGEQIKGLFLIKQGDFEITQKFRKQLDEKYKGQAFPVKIRKNIKWFVAGRNEALGLEFILGFSTSHNFSWRWMSSSATYYFIDKEVRNFNEKLKEFLL